MYSNSFLSSISASHVNKFCLTLAVIPPILIAVSIFLNWEDVLFWDEWELVPFFEKYERGELGYADFIWPHNEHRLILTKLIYLLGYTTLESINLGPIIIQYCLVLATAILLCTICWFSSPSHRKWIGVYFLGITILLFSFQLSGVWYWGFTVQQPLTALFFVAALALVIIKRRWAFVLSVVFATLATLSSAIGLFVLPFQFILRLILRRERLELFVTAAAAALLFAWYLTAPGDVRNSAPVDRPLLNLIAYPLLFVGSIFSADSIVVGVISGAVGVGLLLTLVVRYYFLPTKSPVCLLWFAIALFVLAIAGLGSWGRSHQGIAQALDSRYLVLSSLFWISLAALIPFFSQLIPFTRLRHSCLVLVGGLAFMLQASAHKQSATYESIQRDLRLARAAIEHGVYVPNPRSVFQQLYPNSTTVIERLSTLYFLGRRPYSAPLQNRILGSRTSVKDVIPHGVTDGKIEALHCPENISLEWPSATPITHGYEIWGNTTLREWSMPPILGILDQSDNVIGIGFMEHRGNKNGISRETWNGFIISHNTECPSILNLRLVALRSPTIAY